MLEKQYIRLNSVAGERGETFLKRYGGKISSEWLIPKIRKQLAMLSGVPICTRQWSISQVQQGSREMGETFGEAYDLNNMVIHCLMLRNIA